MSRYIDADKLQLYLNDYAFQVSPSGHYDVKLRKWNEIVYRTIDTCMKAVDEQPTADVRENVRGEWIHWYEEIKHDGYTEYIPHCKCPKCETEYDSHTAKFINFCPNCVADMRGGTT